MISMGLIFAVINMRRRQDVGSCMAGFALAQAGGGPGQGLSDLRDDEPLLPLRRKLISKIVGGLDEERKRLVVNGKNRRRFEHVGRNGRALSAHREMIADGQDADLRLKEPADQFHITEYVRVAGVVDGSQTLDGDDDAVGHAAVAWSVG